MLACVAVLLAVPGHARAQQPGLDIAINSVTDADFPVVQAIVTVEDATGAAPGGLDVNSFSVTLDGHSAMVNSADLASSETAPLDVLLVMDASGSMAGAPMAAAQASAKALIKDLGAADRVAIVSFADDVQLTQDYTADKPLAMAAVDRLVARGNTALYQATAAAAVKASRAAASRRVVVLLSDGADFGGKSTMSRDEALAAAATVGVPFFTVAEGSDIDTEYLARLAQSTKGRGLEAPRPEDLANLYAGIGLLLRSQYVLKLDASAVTGAGPTALSVQVRVGAQVANADGTYRPSAGHGAPAVLIEGLGDGEALDVSRDITISVTGLGAVTRVVAYIDGVSVFETTSPPYAFTYDPRSFENGDHVLSVSVISGFRGIDKSVRFSSTPPAPSAGRRIPWGKAGIGGAVLLAVLAAYVAWKKRPRRPGLTPLKERITPWASLARLDGPAAPPEEQDELAPELVGEVLGRLVSVAGSDAGQEYRVGARPVSIGSAAACAVRIDDAELGAVEARTWIQNSRLMLHRTTRLTAIANEESSGGWTILDEGDTFEIGNHRFEFRLLGAADKAAASDAESSPPADAVQPRLIELMPRDSMPDLGELEERTG